MRRAIALLLLALPALARADSAILTFRPPPNAAEAGPLTYRAYLRPELPQDGPEMPIELGPREPDARGEIVASVTVLSFGYVVSVTASGPGGESERSAEKPIPAAAPAPAAPDLEKVERLIEGAQRNLDDARKELRK